MQGNKKSVVKKSISCEDYKDCLFSENTQMRKINAIRSNTVNDLINAPSLMNTSYLINARYADKFVLNAPL